MTKFDPPPFAAPAGQNAPYLLQLATSQADIEAAQMLRARAFLSDQSTSVSRRDQDHFDDSYTHLLVRRKHDNHLCGTVRYHLFRDPKLAKEGYTGQFYGLEKLSTYPKAIAEIGRLCICPTVRDPFILRMILAWIAQFAHKNAVGLFFGCASFAGNDPAPYTQAFAKLARKHLGAPQWAPSVKATKHIALKAQHGQSINNKAALSQMPPLLRAYLGLGGWVSDHAVIDEKMNTMHAFTALEVDRIPPSRIRSLLRFEAG